MPDENLPTGVRDPGAEGVAPGGSGGAPEVGAPVQDGQVDPSEGGNGGDANGRVVAPPNPNAVWRTMRQVKELSEQISQFREIMPVLKQLTDMRRSPEAVDPSKTQTSDFYRDPLGTIQRLLEEKLTGIVPKLKETMDQRESSAAFEKRRDEATRWIESQKDYSPDAEEEMVSIINALSQDPVARAQAAVALWRSAKGAGGGAPRVPKAAAAGVSPAAGSPGRRGDIKGQMDAIMADSKMSIEEKVKALDEIKSGMAVGT